MKTSGKLLLLPLLAASSIAVNAATRTFDDALTFTFTESLGSNVLTLSQFDGALGTLTGVKITIQYTVPVQTLELDNDATGAATGTYGFGEFGGSAFSASASTSDGLSSLGLGDFGYTTQSSLYSLTADTGTEGSGTFDTQPGESDYFTFDTTAVTFGEVDRVITSLAWAQYTGTGNITFDLAKNYSLNISDNSLAGTGTLRQASTLTTGTFSASVTYDYTPVPEPSSFAALLGLVALGVIGIRRRR
jgi:hypothetical protein